MRRFVSRRMKVAGGVNGTTAVSPGFSYVNGNISASAGGASSIAVTLTGVVAGNLIVIVATGYAASGTLDSVSDGTSSLTGLTQRDRGLNRSRAFYILSSVASGSVTYTLTFSGSMTSRVIAAMQFSYGGTASFAAENFGSAFTSTSLDTGDITVGANCVTVAFSVNEGNYAVSGATINGENATVGPANSVLDSFYLIKTAGYTGDFKGTLATTSMHVEQIVGFQSS